MIFEWMSDPQAWLGLGTLILLEVVLGVDNLVFIAILAEKLPPEMRDRARLIGIALALVMRLVLLASISWIISLDKSLLSLGSFDFSGKDLILLAGGLFLIYKATKEIHERMEGASHGPGLGGAVARLTFGQAITQIILLDLVFSIDSIITAVGMVEHLSIMYIAVIVAVTTMLLLSKPLIGFIHRHPTVVILCLGFLLMIGLSLIAEAFHFKIPKGYLYAAMGFSILVEVLNQMVSRRGGAATHAAPTPISVQQAAAGIETLSRLSAAELAGPMSLSDQAGDMPSVPMGADGMAVLAAIRESRSGAVQVLDASGGLAGVVTARDILRAVTSPATPAPAP